MRIDNSKRAKDKIIIKITFLIFLQLFLIIPEWIYSQDETRKEIRIQIGVVSGRIRDALGQSRPPVIRQQNFPTSDYNQRDLRVFGGEFFRFICVTPDNYRERLKDFPEIWRGRDFGGMLKRLIEEKKALIQRYRGKYPYYCQHVNIGLILIEHGFSWKDIIQINQIFPKEKEGFDGREIKQHFYWLVVYNNNDAFIIDLAADQFELIGPNTFAEVGIVILPWSIIEKNPRHFWMYSGTGAPGEIYLPKVLPKSHSL